MKIALTGATGFIGSHLAERLSQQGHELTCLVRPSSKLVYLQNLRWHKIIGDTRQPDTLAPFISDQDVVIHIAGLNKARTEEEYFQANVTSTKNLLDLIVAHNSGLQRFVLISSQAAAGPSSAGIYLTETTPANPITPYGRSKARAEQLTIASSQKIPVTIIRPPAVFGPRDRDILTYFKLIHRGVQPLIGYENIVSIVYVKNLVHGIELAMSNSRAINQTYFICDDGSYTWSQLGGMIARALEKNPVSVEVPGWMVSSIAAMNTWYSSLFKKAVLLNREKILEMKQLYWTVSSQKAKEELGYHPLISTEEGIRETAAWYRDHGWL